MENSDGVLLREGPQSILFNDFGKLHDRGI